MMQHLFSLTLTIWRPLLFSSVFSLLTVAANIGLMATSAYLISLAALHPPLAALSTAIVGVRFFGLSRALARYVERFTGHDAALRLLREIRVWCFRSLEPLPASEFAKYASADLFSRMVADVETLKYLPVRIICPLVAALVLLFVITVLLFTLQPSLAILYAVGLLIMGCIIPWFLHRRHDRSKQDLSTARLQFHTSVVDTLHGIRDLAAFGRIEKMQQTLETANNRLLNTLHTSLQKNALADTAGQLTASLIFIAALALLVGLVRIGIIDGVVLAAWALIILSSFEAFLPLPLMFRYWQDSREAAVRLFSFIPAQQSPPKAGGNIPLQPFRLTVENVCLSYSGKSTQVLDQISFELAPGKRLAIVGASGSGKSSLISLLAGLQPYDSGIININGINVNTLPPQTMQEIFGVILQHDYLFHETIADNLRLARPTASDQELWQALDQVFLSDTVRRLPAGLETRLGNDGHGLSGGERRRLSLARLQLKNPAIILLDEPTAGLDPLLSAQLLTPGGALLPTDRTIVLATHQFTGLAQMDEILVLDQGRIVERGCWNSLLAQRGFFYQLWLLQQDRFEYST